MNKFILLLLFPVLSFSQTLSEDLEFYDNGKTRVKVYKNMDLEMVKRNILFDFFSTLKLPPII